MINRAELKLNAKAQIKGNIGVLFVILLQTFHYFHKAYQGLSLRDSWKG